MRDRNEVREVPVLVRARENKIGLVSEGLKGPKNEIDPFSETLQGRPNEIDPAPETLWGREDEFDPLSETLRGRPDRIWVQRLLGRLDDGSLAVRSRLSRSPYARTGVAFSAALPSFSYTWKRTVRQLYLEIRPSRFLRSLATKRSNTRSPVGSPHWRRMSTKRS